MTCSGVCVLREAHHLPFELYSPRSSLITFGCIWRCYPLTGHVRSKRLTSQRNQIWSNNHIWILRGKFGWSVEIFFPYKKRSPIRHVVSCQVLQMMTVAERIASPIIYGSLSWQPVPIGVDRRPSGPCFARPFGCEAGWQVSLHLWCSKVWV